MMNNLLIFLEYVIEFDDGEMKGSAETEGVTAYGFRSIFS